MAEPSETSIGLIAEAGGPAHVVVRKAIGPERYLEQVFRILRREGWPEIGMVEAEDGPPEESPEWIAAERQFAAAQEEKARLAEEKAERARHLEEVEKRPLAPVANPEPPTEPQSPAPTPTPECRLPRIPRSPEDPDAIGHLARRLNNP